MLSILLLVVVIFSLTIGSKFINLQEIANIIFNKKGASFLDYEIVVGLRLPRVILAVIVGMTLALSGLVFQTILKNPLAEPFTLGISSGASFGAALGLFLSNYVLHFRVTLFPFALLGGLVTILILFYFATKKNVSLFTIIFVGISISYFFNALLTFMMSLLGDKSYEILLWMFGTLTNPPEMKVLLLFFGVFLLFFFIILSYNKKLDILYMSDEVVKSLGVNINTTRMVLLILTSFLTILSVSFCGIIGFVGLIVPHIARFLVGNNHKFLVPSVSLIGGILLVLSDDIARSVIGIFNTYGKELPIGVVTSLLGTPFFLYLLIKSRRFL